MTVWDLLRQYAATQPGTFTPQEALSWLRRHSASEVNDRTVRTHIRGACWNVGDRSQFARKEPFLTRVDRGVFRVATAEEVERWRSDLGSQASDRSQPQGDGGAGAATLAVPSIEAALDNAKVRPVPTRDEWHTEANVQALLVTALATDGWRILSVANTATKEHGIDVIASKPSQTVGFEVKGFPSRAYADPARAGEQKRTGPSSQATHWYAQAVLAAMRLRDKEPAWRSAIALPDFPRYRSLHSETSGSLAAAGIEVWWVGQTGTVNRP